MAAFVKEHFTRMGWYVKIHRAQGGFFSADDYIDLHEKLRSEGYQPYATVLDYLGNMKFDGGKDSNINNSQAIHATVRRIRNYNNYNNVLFYTAWQLDTKAGELASMGPNPVKKFNISTHLKDCKTIPQEFDAVFFMHLEHNADRVRFLTIRRVKGRDMKNLSFEEEYTAYAFTEHGIPDDYGKTPTYTRNIHSYIPRGDSSTDDDLFG
jgi:hypothetical protein